MSDIRKVMGKVIKKDISYNEEISELDLCRAGSSGAGTAGEECDALSSLLGMVKEKIDDLNRSIAKSFGDFLNSVKEARNVIDLFIKSLSSSILIYDRIEELLNEAIDDPSKVRENCGRIVIILMPYRAQLKVTEGTIISLLDDPNTHDSLNIERAIGDEILATERITVTCKRVGSGISLTTVLNSVEDPITSSSHPAKSCLIEILYYVKKRRNIIKNLIQSLIRSSKNYSKYMKNMENAKEKTLQTQDNLRLDTINTKQGNELCSVTEATIRITESLKKEGSDRVREKIKEGLMI